MALQRGEFATETQPDTCPPAESGTGLESKGNARVAPLQTVQTDGHPTQGRIEDDHAPLPNSLQYDEVAELPMQDAGQRQILQFHHLQIEAYAVHPPSPGGLDKTLSTGAFPARAAGVAQLGNGDPVPVVGQDHGQAGDTALIRFHLLHKRHSTAPQEWDARHRSHRSAGPKTNVMGRCRRKVKRTSARIPGRS